LTTPKNNVRSLGHELSGGSCNAVPRTVRAGIGAIAVLTVGLAIWYRWGYGLTVDEPFMANTTRLPLHELWSVLPIDNLPFAYLLLKFWTAIFGESELALRALSSVAYGAAVWFTGLAAARAGGTAAGLVAAVLLAASDRVGLEHAATARPYALLAGVAGCATWQSVRLLSVRATSWRSALLLGTTHLVGMLTHPIYALMPAASALSAIAIGRRLRSAVADASLVALLVYAVAWGPMVYATIHLHTTSWMQPPTLADVERGYMLLWGVGPGFMLAGALAVVVAGNTRRTREVLGQPVMAWAVLTSVLVWSLALSVSLVKPIFEPTRTPVLLLPITSLSLACVLVRIGGRGAGVVLAAACALAAAHRVASLPAADPYPTRASLSTLLHRMACGDTVVAPGLASGPVEYYFRQLDAPSCLGREAFPRNVVNWVGQLRDPMSRQRLEEEVEGTAAQLGSRGGTVWLLRLNRGELVEASEMIETALRRRFVCDDRLPLRGAFFDDVIQCVRERHETRVH
jgi:dolichyl-phosphate-mannose-protein mannosyltransferase